LSGKGNLFYFTIIGSERNIWKILSNTQAAQAVKLERRTLKEIGPKIRSVGPNSRET